MGGSRDPGFAKEMSVTNFDVTVKRLANPCLGTNWLGPQLYKRVTTKNATIPKEGNDEENLP